MKIKLLPENERPLEKALKSGVDRLSNPELLALILHTGTRSKSAVALAEEVLSLYPDGISGLGAGVMEELLSIDGIGPMKACGILAAVELGKRISTSSCAQKFCADTPEQIAGLFMEELRYRKKEQFKTVLVNAKGELITVDDVSTGELSSTVVHPREVFQLAVRKSAAAVIFVHNHPSGDPSPSGEDVQSTERLARAGALLGIRVLDHIIIGDGRFSSMRELGMLD